MKKITNYTYSVDENGTLTIYTRVCRELRIIATLEECVNTQADERGIRNLIEGVLEDLGYKIKEQTYLTLKANEKESVLELFNVYENGDINEEDVISYFKEIRPKSYKYAVEKLARCYGINPRKCSSIDEIFDKMDIDTYNDFVLDLKNTFFEKCNLFA